MENSNSILIRECSLEDIKNLMAEIRNEAIERAQSVLPVLEDRLYDLSEAADILSMSPTTLRKKKDKGVIGHVNDGTIKFKRDHIYKYIKKHEHEQK